MPPPRKVIISCAITGSIHTPSMSDSLPITAKQIAQSAIGAAKEGAAIVHLHARDPITGRPDQSAELFEPFLKVIKQESDCVVNITTGGSMTMTVEQRLQPALRFKPELASLNMGSMNFGLFPMVSSKREFRYEWERPYLESSRKGIFRNTFEDIEFIINSCRHSGTRFEFECYDAGHLYTLAHFADRKLVEPPFFIQSVFGVLGGVGSHPQDVAYMKATADRLFGDQFLWSVLGAGRHQMQVATMSTAMGGHVRVGLEDSLWLKAGTLAHSNAQQVLLVRGLIEGLGCEVATPAEARSMLSLKGADSVEF